MKMPLMNELTKGIWKENPILRIMLGFCPMLAITTSATNAIGMGLCVIFVLVGSNLFISALRNIIPGRVRIPCFIVVIATFVTIVDLCLNAFTPGLYKSLGLFIPLIVVNCIILGRAEAFASKASIVASILDGVGMGVGFTLALLLLSSIREIIGNGTWFGHAMLPHGYIPVLVMIMPPGAFVVLGFILAGMNKIDALKKAKS